MKEETIKDCASCKHFIPSSFFLGEGSCVFDSNKPCRVNTRGKHELSNRVWPTYEKELGNKIVTKKEIERPGKPNTEGFLCEFWEASK